MKKLGIIVPYRNRYEHLQEFKIKVNEYLKNQGYRDYVIIVVEQDNAKLFNRGKLCNIGFIESKKQNCDYVIFHDVDMIPIDVDYSYSEYPVHLATDNLPFDSYFGGITLFPTDVFEKINGFSNLYWGWGFEDDDLRYRCIKQKIPFEKSNIENNIDDDVPIFNGVNAYATIPNVINYNRDFKIIIDINLDRLVYNIDKQYDIFPILSITGYDFKIYYNSFNRFYIQAFDKNGKYYDIFSDIVTFSNNKLEFEYKRKDKKISFSLNGKLQNEIILDKALYDYSKENIIYFGTDTLKENYFKGTLNYFSIIQNNENKILYKTKNTTNYKLNDISDNKNHGEFHKVYFDKFKTPLNYYSFIPFRRKSEILKLEHEDCGFKDGRWKDDNSRWNQLRYNNEVQEGSHDDLNDGLTTCKYNLYGCVKDKKYIHLTVGI